MLKSQLYPLGPILHPRSILLIEKLVAPVGKMEFKDFPVEVIDPPSKQVLAGVDIESVL